jgi:ADP-heptose:LPS heptosyltransferase
MSQGGITPSKAIVGFWAQCIARILYAAGSLRRALAHRPRDEDPFAWTARERRQVHSVALIRLDEMGDFTLFTSILGPLRRAFPEARITLVLCDWICPLAELCPYVDEVIPFPSGGAKWLQFMLGPFRAVRIARQMGRSVDLVINPRFDRDIRGAAFLAHFSLASRVIGYPSSTDPFKAAVNRGYDSFYTHLIPAPAGVMHEVERSRAVLEFLGIPADGGRPELWISDEDRRQAAGLLRQDGWRPGDTLICLGINAGYPRKRWPIHLFIQLARRLMSMQECRFVVVGGEGDRETAELLRPALGPRLINLAGRAALRVSAAVLGECLIYAGNDSGPKHLAAAMGKPVVEITCHPKDGDATHFQAPGRFGSTADPGIVLAPRTALAPCTATCLAGEPHCIRQVSVDEVLEAVAALTECHAIAHP